MTAATPADERFDAIAGMHTPPTVGNNAAQEAHIGHDWDLLNEMDVSSYIFC